MLILCRLGAGKARALADYEPDGPVANSTIRL